MIVNEEEAFKRIDSPDNLSKKLDAIRGIITPKSRVTVERVPQSDGPKGIPPKVQQLIAVLSSETTQKETAKAFGVTQAMASKYERGETVATVDIAKDIKNSKQARIDTAHDHALDAMVSSITLVKNKLADPELKIKATDLAKIASAMGKVIESTSPKEAAHHNVVVQVYAPRLKKESEFEEISVG